MSNASNAGNTPPAPDQTPTPAPATPQTGTSAAAGPPPGSVPPPAAPPKPWIVRYAPWFTIAAVLGLVAFSITNWNVWVAGRPVQSTENAYVKQDGTTLSARVPGYVRSVLVQDFQRVSAGDVIALIDDEEYLVAVAQADAALARTRATLAKLSDEKALNRAQIAQAQAAVGSARARHDQHSQDAKRQTHLAGQGFASQQKLEGVRADRAAAQSTLAGSIASLDHARRQLDVLAASEPERVADVNTAEARLRTAQLQLGHTRIIAPFDGTVNARRVQAGSLVGVGTQIIAIVPSETPYIIANYKETQLAHVEADQPAEIRVDAFPGVTLKGRVERIAPASGAETALLPNENASGNFTKVVQRIAVRIALDPTQEQIVALRPGMSVQARILVKGEPVAPYAAASDKAVASAVDAGH
ncbi:HlyD family secretion protein [Achromobacter seleniivolatilans]|uniref:HlyD family secretion protein n=1 Tax=Achromobacter seleniivolatilans TaxID=3047478 RepID=A0ABY9M2D1_9BURK|nr:HlyD family secretion protein [Achromobacter sp. R39]WMD20847.1 HlyD family secretion protein [Achromobacter sp. R39]